MPCAVKEGRAESSVRTWPSLATPLCRQVLSQIDAPASQCCSALAAGSSGGEGLLAPAETRHRPLRAYRSRTRRGGAVPVGPHDFLAPFPRRRPVTDTGGAAAGAAAQRISRALPPPCDGQQGAAYTPLAQGDAVARETASRMMRQTVLFFFPSPASAEGDLMRSDRLCHPSHDHRATSNHSRR